MISKKDNILGENMKNIFVIGSKVKGKSFIGRKQYLKEFKRAYFNKNSKTTRSIVGLTRMGKSSFVFNL